jgi:RNA polymerase sigma factor (sigma-70 family)
MTTAELVATHERLTRYVHGHFKRKLTYEDARDASAEALAELDRASGTIVEPERWLRRAAWRNALDMIRKAEGEGKTPRERPSALGDDVDRLPDHETPEGVLLKAALHDADTAALAEAVKALKPDEHRALHLRYIDDLDVPSIIDILGCSRHQYESLHKRGLKKLREALVAPATTTACRSARALILASAFGGLDSDDAVRRDAHVETCLSCRAFARRRDGLLAALPLPAAPGILGRLAALLGGGGAATAKVAAVCATCAVATGAGTAVEQHHQHMRRHQPSRSAQVVRHSRPSAAPAQASNVSTAPRAAVTTTASAPATSSGRIAHQAHRLSRVAPKHTAHPSTDSPFLPESGADPAPSTSAATPLAHNATAKTATPLAPTSTSTKPPSTPKSASFSGEFTP